MTLACSSAVSYVESRNVVHSIDRTSNHSASLGGGSIAEMYGNAPFGGGRICGQGPGQLHRAAEQRSAEVEVYTYGECLLDCPLCRHDRYALNVESMLTSTGKGKSSFVGVRGQLERGEEERIALYRVVAERPGVHGDQLALARCLCLR